jgi:tryptophan synthase alpha chain
MENRIQTLFRKKDKNILSIYFTAGYPELEDTVEIIRALENNGVDLIEIGIPFSDPVADGPVIQQSSDKALKNGMNLNLLFKQLENIRQEVSIPLILMGYFNPVMQYGVERFCQICNEIGIDGTILPDLPVDVFEEKYDELFNKNNVLNIFLITPQTSEERIRKIDSLTKGFIYMVSSSSTTGIQSNIIDSNTDYFERIKAMNLRSPKLTGFGISDRDSFNKACRFTNGAIIGSSFVKALAGNTNIRGKVHIFVEEIISR